jgi:acetyl esterase/lipase
MAVAGGAAIMLSAAGCAVPSASLATTPLASPAAPTPTPATSILPDDPPAVIDTEYLPGLSAQVRLPGQPGAAPLVVLVPGGGWRSADPWGLIPLAERITASGASTVLITYRTTSSGSTFPEAADDVACAIRWSAAEVAARDHPATDVVVLGHSAGGHLAALVTFSGEEFGKSCPNPPVSVDGLIGVAGVYDIEDFRDYLARWMGFAPTEKPQEWLRADPLTWARDGGRLPPSLRVLLVHGEDDTTVPPAQTALLREVLDDKGIAARAELLSGVDHISVFDAAVLGPIVDAWLAEAMDDNP